MLCFVGHLNMTSQSHLISISDSNNNVSVPILGYNMSTPVTVLGILTIEEQDLSVKVYPSVTSIVISPTMSSYTISSPQSTVTPSSSDSSSILLFTMKTVSTAISSNMIKSSSNYINNVSTSRPPSTIIVRTPSSAALTHKNWDDVIIAVLLSIVCTALVAVVIGLVGCYGSYRYGQRNGYQVTKGNFNIMETETYLVQSVSM